MKLFKSKNKAQKEVKTNAVKQTLSVKELKNTIGGRTGEPIRGIDIIVEGPPEE